MAYDTELADRIRFLIGTGPGLTEKKMFGGLAFLIHGNMAISASGQGGALIRVDPADCGTLARVSDDHEAGWLFPLVIYGAGGGFRVLPMSAPGGVAGEAENAGELVLDRGGLGEHAVGSGPAAAAVVEQDGLADAGEFGE